MNRRRQRNNHLPNAKLAGIAARVHRTGATESKQHKASGIVSLLHRGLADQVAHMRVGYTVNCAGGFDLAHLERLRDLFTNRCERFFLVQFHPAAEEVVFIEITEDEIRIGDRGFFAAHAVANRPRRSSRALRSHLEQTRFRVDPGNASSAGANGFDPDLRGENAVP